MGVEHENAQKGLVLLTADRLSATPVKDKAANGAEHP